MLARPPPSPWRNTTIGEHFPSGARAPAQAGTLAFVAAGRAIRTLIVSSAVVPVGLKAPVAGSIRLKVVMVVSITSAMLLLATVLASTPYLLNATAAVLETTVPGFPLAGAPWAILWGSAPSRVPVERLDCVWKGSAIATLPASAVSAARTRLIFSRM